MVKLSMRNLPFRIVELAFRAALFDPPQTVQRRNHGNFPIVPAFRYRSAQQFDFDQDPRVGNLSEVAPAHRGNTEAALLLGQHEALGGEGRQRLAQRCEACAEMQP